MGHFNLTSIWINLCHSIIITICSNKGICIPALNLNEVEEIKVLMWLSVERSSETVTSLRLGKKWIRLGYPWPTVIFFLLLQLRGTYLTPRKEQPITG